MRVFEWVDEDLDGRDAMGSGIYDGSDVVAAAAAANRRASQGRISRSVSFRCKLSNKLTLKDFPA